MDERTRRTIDEAPPDPRTVPAPIITKPRGGRTRIVLGLIVVNGLLVFGYLIFRWAFAAAPRSCARPAGGRHPIGRRRPRRPRRYSRGFERARNRHADCYHYRGDTDRWAGDFGALHRGADRQQGRYAGANRRPALPAAASPIRRPARPGSRRARAGASRSRPLPKTRRAEFDRPPAIRGPSLHRTAEPRHGETRSSADRSAKAQRPILPHRPAGDRPRRHPPH